MLGRAVALASKIHEFQKDKGGNAYILHPMRIMMRLRTDDEELMQIAILHDVIEDSKSAETPHTVTTLRELGFTDRVLRALELLTHNPEDSYEDYVKKIATNADALRVKLEDLRDNADITRLKGLRSKDFERMEKYHRAFTFLKTAHENMKKCGY